MKLPNAPLLEVIFELRWALEGGEDVPVQLRHDPAYPLLAYEFTENAKPHGFTVRRERPGGPAGPLGHSIHYRYHQGDNTPFPMWQIGPGIFAYNESTDYEWSSYKASLRTALRALLASYPKSKALKMQPVHLELRYLNSFDSELLGHVDLAKFLSNDVKIKMKPNNFLKSNALSGPFNGRLEINRQLKRDKKSSFKLEIATGKAKEKPGVLVISKVVKMSDDLDIGSNSRSMVSNVIRWADAAHELTHEFFQDFVGDELMKNFSE